MSLRLTVSKSLAMFVFETEEMTTTVTISQDDDQATIMSKLGKLTDFIRREQPHALAPTSAPGWTGTVQTSEPLTPAKAHAFTGIPPVQPPSYDASLAQAAANGWELITGDED